MRIRKICPRCKTLKLMDDFGTQEKTYDKKEYLCKICIEEPVIDELVGQVKYISESRRIFQIDVLTKEKVNEFKTPSEAGLHLGKNPLNIRVALRGASKTAHGFLWKYEK